MSRYFHLNSHRTSHDVPDNLPSRRFTDSHLTSLKPVDTHPSVAQKTIYFQPLLYKKSIPSDIGNMNRHESATGLSNIRTLDLRFFSRKNAVVEGKQDVVSYSPHVVQSYKQTDTLSSTHSKANIKKYGSSSGHFISPNEVLKLRVIELEKKLKNFEKTSRTFRTDISGDKINRKKSGKTLALLSLNSPLMATDTHSMRSKVNKTTKTIKQKAVFSESKYEASQHRSVDRSNLIEAGLAKLRDRISTSITKDKQIMNTLDRIVK